MSVVMLVHLPVEANPNTQYTSYYPCGFFIPMNDCIVDDFICFFFHIRVIAISCNLHVFPVFNV